jgi:hypothetical protein
MKAPSSPKGFFAGVFFSAAWLEEKPASKEEFYFRQ